MRRGIAHHQHKGSTNSGKEDLPQGNGEGGSQEEEVPPMRKKRGRKEEGMYCARERGSENEEWASTKRKEEGGWATPSGSDGGAQHDNDTGRLSKVETLSSPLLHFRLQ